MRRIDCRKLRRIFKGFSEVNFERIRSGEKKDGGGGERNWEGRESKR